MRAASIFFPARFFALARADFQSISRDPILLVVVVFSATPMLALVLWGAPIDTFVQERIGLERFTELAMGFVLVLPAILLGWVTGMLILEDRDEGVLLAIETTPVGKNGFLLYRTALTAAVIFSLTLVALRLLAPDTREIHLALSVFVAAEAVMIAFATVALAGNKVEGLVLSKFFNALALVPLLALIPSAMRFAAGIIPSYWVGEMLYVLPNGNLELMLKLTISAFVHGTAGVYIVRKALRRIG